MPVPPRGGGLNELPAGLSLEKPSLSTPFIENIYWSSNSSEDVTVAARWHDAKKPPAWLTTPIWVVGGAFGCAREFKHLLERQGRGSWGSRGGEL